MTLRFDTNAESVILARTACAAASVTPESMRCCRRSDLSAAFSQLARTRKKKCETYHTNNRSACSQQDLVMEASSAAARMLSPVRKVRHDQARDNGAGGAAGADLKAAGTCDDAYK